MTDEINDIPAPAGEISDPLRSHPRISLWNSCSCSLYRRRKSTILKWLCSVNPSAGQRIYRVFGVLTAPVFSFSLWGSFPLFDVLM